MNATQYVVPAVLRGAMFVPRQAPGRREPARVSPGAFKAAGLPVPSVLPVPRGFAAVGAAVSGMWIIRVLGAVLPAAAGCPVVVLPGRDGWLLVRDLRAWMPAVPARTMMAEVRG